MRADNHDAAGGILAHAGEFAGERAMLMQSSQTMAGTNSYRLRSTTTTKGATPTT